MHGQARPRLVHAQTEPDMMGSDPFAVFAPRRALRLPGTAARTVAAVSSLRRMSDLPEPTHLRLDRHEDGVAVLTLDNPDQRNAMSEAMTASWVSAVDALAGDPSVRVVVVTGEGSAFCSGGDTGWIAGEPDASVDQLRTRMVAFYRAWLSVRRLEVPTIAAVNGPAIGAGLCLALACDLRYGAAGARLGAPFVRLGMHAGMAATYLLPQVVGEAHARDLLLTGRTVGADEALRLGLVSAVLPDEGFLDGVLQTARGIAGTAPIASRLTTVALRGGGHPDVESAVQWEALAQPVTLATADLQEGVRAAREKRRPRFAGR
jgi:enoyl-CoA hydratase/carnithine racemase